MANLKSSIKDIRRISRRTERNRRVTSRLKTLRKKLLVAVDGEDSALISKSVNEYTSALDKAAKVGVVHKNKVNREKARVAAKVNSK